MQRVFSSLNRVSNAHPVVYALTMAVVIGLTMTVVENEFRNGMGVAGWIAGVVFVIAMVVVVVDEVLDYRAEAASVAS